ncbi:MAG: CatB-related O-acetyltransferase [Candidatus Thiodiazotropha taylori]
MNLVLVILRRLQTYYALLGKSKFLTVGKGLHIGRGVRLWAPDSISIGDCVYIGKYVHIEANCSIGNYCLIANKVAIIGRHDHDFKAIGYPVRFSPWIGSKLSNPGFRNEKAIIDDDVWIGYGAIILTGIKIGRGAIIAAGSIVTTDVPRYSIVGGIPSRVIGTRFSNKEDIDRHEKAIKNGVFVFSEKGYDECIVKPNFHE